ncbi:hypothetical protein ES703_31039 [subsurface metagenome]
MDTFIGEDGHVAAVDALDRVKEALFYRVLLNSRRIFSPALIQLPGVKVR